MFEGVPTGDRAAMALAGALMGALLGFVLGAIAVDQLWPPMFSSWVSEAR